MAVWPSPYPWNWSMKLTILPCAEELLAPSKKFKGTNLITWQMLPGEYHYRVHWSIRFRPIFDLCSFGRGCLHLCGSFVDDPVNAKNTEDCDNNKELIVIQLCTLHIPTPVVIYLLWTILPVRGSFAIEITSNRQSQKQKHISHDIDIDAISEDVVEYIRNKLTSTILESRARCLNSLVYELDEEIDEVMAAMVEL